MDISIVIPAYNEEAYLSDTLRAVTASLGASQMVGEVIVVDNNSTDRTRDVARDNGARVEVEPARNISAVRNTGGRSASGEILVFLDADTVIPHELIATIRDAMRDRRCFGGAVAVRYAGLERRWVKYYLAGWKFWARFFGMAQGATQFCRKADFQEIGGYDSAIFVGEDIEFYWRLSQFARKQTGYLKLITEIQVTTSARRFNKMSVCKLLVLTHPVFIRLAWRRRGLWKDWYDRAIR